MLRVAALQSQLGVDSARIAVAIADGDEERAAATAELERAQAAHKSAVKAFDDKSGLARNAEVVDLFPQVAEWASLF